MGERGFAIKQDLHKAKWENDDFPMVCEGCLGENPYVRMIKDTYGAGCKLCDRPYSVFRWKPGKKGKYKRTEICQTCARTKNVCQTCILDLMYGLPVEVRDAVLAMESKGKTVGQSDANREYQVQVHERELALGNVKADEMYGGKTNKALLQLARSDPYYAKNKSHLCSFYAKGECTRGDECPYLHGMDFPENEDKKKSASIQDRYNGTNDPVASDLLTKRKAKGSADTTSPKTKKTR